MSSIRGGAGQQVLAASAVANGEGSRAAELERRLGRREHDRSVAHAALLADVLALARENDATGHGLGTAAQLALLLDCSSWRAHDLLAQAALFDRLPDGLARLQAGWLTEEQVRAVTAELAPLSPADAALVFAELVVRVDAERAAGVCHPPARLRELLRRLVAALLPDELTEQRQRNAVEDDVSVQRNDDGTTNLLITGVSGPNTQSALHRIAADAQPADSWDTRTDGQRRRDAAVDLLTGRTSLPLAEPHTHPADRPTRCGCMPGSQVPCGAGVQVLVPLATTLGLSSVPAELLATLTSGGGVLDPALLRELLLNAPALTAVFTDEHGTPVAVGDTTLSPQVRHDPAALAQALLRLAATPPREVFPVHPDDHPPPGDLPPGDLPDDDPPDDTARLDDHPPHDDPPHDDPPDRDRPDDERVLARAALGLPADADLPHAATTRPTSPQRGRGPHSADRAGPYGIRPRLRTLLHVRSVRCEWPGCGARAQVCDLDHDLHWPDGPTCACNLGALCRQHHRIKQTGWTKTRDVDGSVLWTSPTGRQYRSPSAHSPVPTPTAPPPPDPDLQAWLALPAATRDDFDRLTDPASPLWAEWERSLADPAWLAATPDHDPDGHADHTGDLLRSSRSLWQLDRHDPHQWQPAPPLPDVPPLDA